MAISPLYYFHFTYKNSLCIVSHKTTKNILIKYKSASTLVNGGKDFGVFDYDQGNTGNENSISIFN